MKIKIQITGEGTIDQVVTDLKNFADHIKLTETTEPESLQGAEWDGKALVMGIVANRERTHLAMVINEDNVRTIYPVWDNDFQYVRRKGNTVLFILEFSQENENLLHNYGVALSKLENLQSEILIKSTQLQKSIYEAISKKY